MPADPDQAPDVLPVTQNVRLRRFDQDCDRLSRWVSRLA